METFSMEMSDSSGTDSSLASRRLTAFSSFLIRLEIDANLVLQALENVVSDSTLRIRKWLTKASSRRCSKQSTVV